MQSERDGGLRRTVRRCADAYRSFFGLVQDDDPPLSARGDASGSRRSPRRFEADGLPSPLSTWKTTEMCRLWRSTSATLRRPLPASELECTSRLRRQCLDELQRRDQEAFGRWLAAPEAVDDPTDFFRHPTRG